MGAADSLDSDLALAVGAFLGGGLLRLFHGLLVQHIDGLDGQKQYEGHDEEVDDGVEKSTNADANIADRDDDVREIGVEEQADDGGDDVVYQRVDDRGESRADDHTDCHVEHIAAHGEGFEFFKEILDAAGFLFWHDKYRSFCRRWHDIPI